MESKNIESTYEGIQQNEQIELQQQMISNLKKQLQDKDKKITKLMTENQKLKIVQLPVENQHSKMTHQENNISINTTKSGQTLCPQTLIAFTDPTLKTLPNNKEIKFWTTETGEKLLIILNPKHSTASQEFDCGPSVLVKATLWVIVLIHMMQMLPLIFTALLGLCWYRSPGLDTMAFWFAPMITVGTDAIITFIVLLSQYSVVDKIVCVICIVAGFMLNVVGVYVIYCHQKWFHENKNQMLPKRTIKIDYAKNEIIVQHTLIIYGFLSRKIETTIRSTIPIGYDNRYFFSIQTDEEEDGSGLISYYHSLYAGDFGDRQKVFKLDKDDMSKQTAQTYGNTLIEMINDNQNADLH